MSEPRGPSASTVTFRAKFVAGREVVFRLAFFVHAFVAGEDAGDAILFVEKFLSRKLREDVHALLPRPSPPSHFTILLSDTT